MSPAQIGSADSSLVDRLLLQLRWAGYSVSALSGGEAPESRARGFRAQLRLGEVAGAVDSARRLVLSSDIDLRGDIATGAVRRWRIERYFPEFDGSVGWELRMLVSLSGDVSRDFIATEGRNANGLLQSLLSDGRLALASARVLPAARAPAVPGPDLVIDVLGVSDLATGRYRLAWYGDRRPIQTPDHRRVRLAACDRLSEEVLPFLAMACAALVDRRLTSQTTRADGHVRRTWPEAEAGPVATASTT